MLRKEQALKTCPNCWGNGCLAGVLSLHPCIVCKGTGRLTGHGPHLLEATSTGEKAWCGGLGACKACDGDPDNRLCVCGHMWWTHRWNNGECAGSLTEYCGCMKFVEASCG